jgi:RNA-splicing ligase RtcB
VTDNDRLKVWGRRNIDDNTIEQASLAAGLPFVTPHVALMPDAHRGIGATVGSVIPTKGHVVPSFAGVDLGCGMIATRTSFTADDLPENLDELMPLVAQRIPAGVGQGHADDANDRFFRRLGRPYTLLTDKQESTARTQFGSLGSGNHFVEVCLDASDTVWTVLHSGSRGIGNQLATMHIERAKGVLAERFETLADPDLAYFTENTPEFHAYIEDMMWAQRYAYESRERMNRALLRSLVEVLRPAWRFITDGDIEMRFIEQTINAHHNYTEQEWHYGQWLWITRKGAIKAGAHDWGVIPGSMGTDTYIVRGLGAQESFHSSSHGAGRKMSRNQARKQLDHAGLEAAMAGKTWNQDANSLIDEDPRAYKDIREVMIDQADLTEVMYRLRQVFNYKGTNEIRRNRREKNPLGGHQ